MDNIKIKTRHMGTIIQVDSDKGYPQEQTVFKRKMEMDNLYLREQKQMKLQISEIVSMITELKDDLTNLNDGQSELSKKLNDRMKSVNRKHSGSNVIDTTTIPLTKDSFEKEEEQEIDNLLGIQIENDSDASTEDDSQVDGLALLQKYIDEDNSSKQDFLERDCFSDNDNWNAKPFVEFKNISTIEKLAPKMFITEAETLQTSDVVEGLLQGDADVDSTTETCEICDAIFLTKDELISHTKIHFTKKTYDCTLCKESFVERVDFAEHFIRCFRAAKERGSLNLQERTCIICGGYYADEISLKKHISFHSKCRLHPCSLCSFRYYSETALQKHMSNVHNPRNKFHCPLCDFSFAQSCYLLTHIAVHSGTRPFCCNLCNYKADTKKALNQHFHLHASNKFKLLKCKECSFVCGSKNVLFRHRMSTHRDPISCEFCDKVFQKTSSYKRHYEIHTNKAVTISCEFCTYETPFERYMKKHMLTHPTLSPFQCTRCGIFISSQPALSQHMRNLCRSLPTGS